MNQSGLIEKVAQATELNQAVAGQAVKAVAHAILDALGWRGGTRFRPWHFQCGGAARTGRAESRTEGPLKSQPARQCASTQARPSKMPSIRRFGRGSPEEVCRTKEIRGAEVGVLIVASSEKVQASHVHSEPLVPIVGVLTPPPMTWHGSASRRRTPGRRIYPSSRRQEWPSSCRGPGPPAHRSMRRTCPRRVARSSAASKRTAAEVP